MIDPSSLEFDDQDCERLLDLDRKLREAEQLEDLDEIPESESAIPNMVVLLDY